MYRGYKVIDSDSHIMEPDDMWEKYLEPEFSRFTPKGGYVHGLLRGEPRFVQSNLEIAGHKMVRDIPGTSFVPDGNGGYLTYAEAYREFIEDGFGPKAYLRYLEWRGLDYIVLYPSMLIPGLGWPGLDPKTAAAIARAYNNWLYDFCDQGGGRLIGAPYIDLRDVDLAIGEVRRCVSELGFKTISLKPDAPLPEIPINHPYYDPLWSTIEELGVPIGTHEGVGTLQAPGEIQVINSGIQGADKAVAFYFGAHLATLMFCGSGGICQRHPGLRIVFTESTAGWAPPWLWFLDELWERFTPYYDQGSERRPSEYFKEQCFISAEPEETGLKCVVEYFNGPGNILYNTDWPHPSEAKISNPADEFLELEGISDSDKRQILWDNAAKLYNLT